MSPPGQMASRLRRAAMSDIWGNPVMGALMSGFLSDNVNVAMALGLDAALDSQQQPPRRVTVRHQIQVGSVPAATPSPGRTSTSSSRLLAC